jgi:uncharacterized protein
VCRLRRGQAPPAVAVTVSRPWLGTARIDAHVHLSHWWPEVERTGYRADLDFSVAGLLREMDLNHVDRALVIQLFQAPSEPEALREGRRSLGESDGRLLPVATVDPGRGKEEVAAVVRLWDGEPRLVGIKLFPGYLPFYPHDRRLDPVYEFAHRRGLPVLLHQGDTLDGLGLIKFARPLEVDEVAGRFRDVRFVLCHLGNPWIDEAAELVYKNENVFTDTSGLLGPPSSPYFERAFAQARDRLEGAIITSGRPERFLYGSDWPLEELRSALRLVEELNLSEADRSAILGGNARRLFRLE